jgi:hypothetical protein
MLNTNTAPDTSDPDVACRLASLIEDWRRTTCLRCELPEDMRFEGCWPALSGWALIPRSTAAAEAEDESSTAHIVRITIGLTGIRLNATTLLDGK